MAHPQSLELKTDSEKTADRYCMLQSQGHCIGFQWGDTTGGTSICQGRICQVLKGQHFVCLEEEHLVLATF